MSWFQQPIAVTRRFLIVAALALGSLAGSGVLLGSIAIDNVAEERERAAERAELTDRDIERIARRVYRLERPGRARTLRQIRRALRECRFDPGCLRRLERAGRASEEVTPVAPDTGAAAPPAGAPEGRRRDRGRRDLDGRGPGRDSPPDRPPGLPPGDPPGEGPREPGPPIDVQLPPVGPLDLPAVCTDLLRVNCR